MRGHPADNKKTGSPRSLSRRDLLCQSAAGSFGTFLLAADTGLQGAEQSGNRVDGWIDAHSHIWTRDIARFPLAEGQTIDDLIPPSFTSDELFAVARPVGVTRVVLIQHDNYHAFDNSYLIHETRRYPNVFRIVGKVDDTRPHPDTMMRDLLRDQVTSFRITPRGRDRGEWLNGAGMSAMWACAADTRQAMGCLIDVEHLPAVDAMCDKFPETPVVIDHFARIGVDGMIRDKDGKALCRLARHKHTHLKLSAYYALGKKRPPYDDLIPMIRHVFEAFGPQRLMWASDAPYQLLENNSYAASVALVRDRLDFISKEDRLWILRKTAEKVYWL